MVTAQVRIVVDVLGSQKEKVFLIKSGNPFTSLSWPEAIATHRALGDLIAKRALCKTGSTA